MTDQQPETPEIVDDAQGAGSDGEDSTTTVSEPAKVMRIGTMIKQLLEEVRATDLDEPGRDRLREIYETSVDELAEALSPDLRDELQRLALPFDEDDIPSGAELRVAQAQLVGWLEGLFHGIQATLFAQQTAARQQLEMMQQSQALPPGQRRPQPDQNQQSGGGVYL
ncbi:MAG: bacterial proteasome activator family protein [Acidimicrobiia bacterium]|nr:bacterial proteasome activator family protein [Acidimicrobiia bacterium]